MLQEHSFRRYIEPLRHHSILLGVIVVATLLLSLVAAAFIAEGLPYEGEAVILLKASGNDRLVLTNGTEFRDTVLDTNRLAQNMQVLVASVDIAQKVQTRGQAIEDSGIKVSVLQALTEFDQAVAVTTKGDLVYIHAKAKTAAAATWLANAWADEALTKINRLYAVSSVNVDDTTAQARATLDADEAALQHFLLTNPIPALTQELTQTQQFLNAATTSQTTAQFTLYDTEHLAIQNKLTASYAYVQTLDQQVREIQALRTRIEQSADDANSLYANQIALLLLPSKVLSSDTGTPLQLQLNPAAAGTTPLSKADQLRDVDATLAAVQKLQGNMQAQITDLEQALQAPRPALAPNTVGAAPAALQDLIQQRNQLESQIEQKQFELAQLQKTRDQDQNTYDLLRSRMAEQQVNATISRVADLGVSATDADTLQSHSFGRTLAWVLGQGLLLAVVLALGLAYALHVLRPGFNSNDAFRRLVRRRTPDAAQVGGRG